MYQITTPNRVIEYSVIQSKRRSVAIVVGRNDKRVTVRAPHGISLEMVHDFVSNKQAWIESKLQEDAVVVQKVFTDGSKHLFMGKLYTLRILSATKNAVKIEHDEIIIETRNPDRAEVVMKLWYDVQANEKIPQIVAQDIIAFSNTYKKSPTSLNFKFVKSYWGLCRADMSITLNCELIKVKESLIRYIICHELCHLVHRNHSSKFYELLSKVYPDWRDARQELADSLKI